MASKWIKSLNVARHDAFSTLPLHRFVIASNEVYLLRFMAATISLCVNSPSVRFQRADAKLCEIQSVYGVLGIVSFTKHTILSARNANPERSQTQSQTQQKMQE